MDLSKFHPLNSFRSLQAMRSPLTADDNARAYDMHRGGVAEVPHYILIKCGRRQNTDATMNKSPPLLALNLLQIKCSGWKKSHKSCIVYSVHPNRYSFCTIHS